jgi:Aspartyl protease
VNQVLSKVKLALTLGTLITLMVGWAASNSAAAPSFFAQQNSMITAPIRFREDRNAGLLVNGWINGAGPFTFAIDTGAGLSLVSRDVVQRTKLTTTKSTRSIIGGLSQTAIASIGEARASQIALGVKTNLLPGKPLLTVVNALPAGVDGIFDPGDLFGDLAYSIDLPNRQILAFDSRTNGLNLNQVPKDGAIVKWVRQRGGNRPFVRLGDGRLALLDTGSGFGLAVSDKKPSSGSNHSQRNVNDLGGGLVQSRSINPLTVSIGSLVLRDVPTDLVVGAASDTPVILGRRALYPFKLTFDPITQLIAFEPTLRNVR